MQWMRYCAAILAGLFWAIPLLAQKEKREPLTGAQIEEIREAGIDPNGRVKLYTKYPGRACGGYQGARQTRSIRRAQPPPGR